MTTAQRIWHEIPCQTNTPTKRKPHPDRVTSRRITRVLQGGRLLFARFRRMKYLPRSSMENFLWFCGSSAQQETKILRPQTVNECGRKRLLGTEAGGGSVFSYPLFLMDSKMCPSAQEPQAVASAKMMGLKKRQISFWTRCLPLNRPILFRNKGELQIHSSHSSHISCFGTQTGANS